MVVCLGLVLSALASFVLACSDDHAHLHAKRDSRASGWLLSPPSRPLQWGELNVIHTTDTHGWLLGHQKQSPPEPNYSGTFGEFADFVQHMKEIALKKDVDLLLIDSGDVHDGTGLSDGFPVGGTDAHESNQFIKLLPYDLLAIGNHELYIYNNTLDMYTDFVPHWNGRYLASNVNITIPDSSNPSQNMSVPVGSRHVKFKTRLGRRVTSFGVLFDFTGNDDGTTVQRVEDMVKEQWFADAIAEEPDLFLLVGHMPVSEDNWPTVFNAVRAVHPTTPILIFGGHAHVRDCVQFDGRSMALASGRYMETVGWMSVDFDKRESSGSKNLTFSRRYLDANRLTYEFHTGRNNHTFDTSYGQSITRGLEDLAVRFDLNFTFGTAPQDYTISRDPYPSYGSSLTLFVSEAVPVALGINNTRSSQGDNSTTPPALFIAVSGSQRFDIFEGPFTKNDQLATSPFRNAFLFLGNVSYGVARQVLGLLNEEGGEASKVKRSARRGEKRWREELYRRGEVEMVYKKWLGEMYAKARELQLQRRDGNLTDETSTVGYVTSDSCPGTGDDTPHAPLPFYSSPAYISSTDIPSSSSSNLTSISDDTPIDLVFVDFIASDVLESLNELETEEGSGKNYTEGDIASYSDLLTNEVFGVFAQQAWS